jgi:hypothetical protein
MQNYNNHTRLHPLHHFIHAPLTIAIFILALVRLIQGTGDTNDGIFNLLVAVALILLSIIARLYALGNQDRVIRLEMRFRYFQKTGSSFQEIEPKLSKGQIVALRFAGDNELLALIDRTIKEGLTSKQIKSSIKDWQADEMRA